MGAFVLLAGLVVLGMVLLAPLMLPGAICVFVVIGLVALARRHHTSHSAATH